MRMEERLIIHKTWAMPNKNTFSIKPIRELIEKYKQDGFVIVDPFANTNKIATITNDLDPQYDTLYHMDATEFLKELPNDCADLILYDPPFSPRQVKESYRMLDMTVNMATTQASYWSRQKEEIARVVKSGGIAITCGWNSGGIGLQRGFEPIEILLVAHGGWHNDTIVTVEQKKITRRIEQ